MTLTCFTYGVGALSVLLLGSVACSAGGGGASEEEPGGTSTGGAPGIGGFPAAGGAFVGAGGSLDTGGTAPVGSGGDPGAGGSSIIGIKPSEPFAGYDPAVAFEWPETTPSLGSCKAGFYQGAFSGMYTSPATFIGFPIPVSGNVDLRLTESANGEFFEISGGTISGLANGLFPFSSGLTGGLNCTTSKLENGFMPGGKYNALGVDYFYEGPLFADYDKLTNAFVNGKWQVGEPTYAGPPAPRPQFGGEGDWGVNYVGP